MTFRTNSGFALALAVSSIALMGGNAQASLSPAVTHAACVSTKTIGGQVAKVFCGPATATVRIGGKTLRFEHGFCQVAGGAFAVNIGTLVVLKPTQSLSYLGIVLTRGTGGGTWHAIALAFRSGGKSYAGAKIRIRISSGLKSGTFSGIGATNPLGTGGAPFAGSFSC